MILNKKKTEKLVDKTKMNVGTEKGGKVSKDIKSFFNSTDIVRVYINASAMKSEDKQTAATGIAYGIFPPNCSQPRLSHTCLNGFDFSYHSAILFGIVRMIKQYVPDNTKLLILTTDASCISLNKEQRKKPKVGLGYIAEYDEICKNKRINAHVHILNHISVPQYIDILNLARKEAEQGLKTARFFNPNN